MMRSRHLVLLSALASGTVASSRVLPQEDELQRVVARLAAAETLDSEAVGYAGIRSDTWKAFLELRRIAGPETLRELANHSDPVVRCYAVRGLVLDHDAEGVARILMDHVDDVEPVAVMNGCIRYEMPVGRVMIREAGEHLDEPALLEVAERHRALGSPLANLALTDTKSRDPEALRERVAAGDVNAIVPLGALRQERDVAAIDAALRKGESLRDVTAALQAAAAHGSPELLSALRSMTPWVKSDLATEACYPVRHWLAALAVQDRVAAKAVLRELAEGLEKQASDRLWRSLAIVLRRFPSPILHTLLPAGF